MDDMLFFMFMIMVFPFGFFIGKDAAIDVMEVVECRNNIEWCEKEHEYMYRKLVEHNLIIQDKK